MTARASLSALLLALGLLVQAGCSAFETNLQDTEVDYLETARQNYEKGQEAFEDETYNEAIKYFQYVKNKYPYSKYAVLADLRVADAHFEREKWLEAADAYRLFVRFHPSNENVPYASYRIALSYYNETSKEPFADIPVLTQIASFLNPFPPARERDQTATKDAIRAFDEYLARFPDDKNAEEARGLRIEARSRLADHDVYAAEFYVQREKWRGAMWRYQKVADDFGDTPLAPGALLEAAEIAEDELEDWAEARRYYQRLLDDYPDTPEADRARSAILRVDKELEREAKEKKAKAEAEAAEKAKAEAEAAEKANADAEQKPADVESAPSPGG